MIEQRLSLSAKQKDYLAIICILSILMIRFYRVVFFNKSISKIFLTAHWDSLFYSLRSGQNFSADCSLNELFIPYRFFVAHYWQHGLPLWNQLNGLGMPLLADPQTLTFCPLYAFFFVWTNLHVWNILLIVQLAIAGIFTYFFSREIGLGLIAALIAAFAYMFCPYLLWQIELLGTGFCFAPLVFFAFTKLAYKKNFWNILFAAICASVDILSCHPEIAFVTVFFASIWFCTNCIYIKGKALWLDFIRAFYSLTLTGLITFGLCAPLLIPFLEYVLAGESYKLNLIAKGLPWQALVGNFVFPFQDKASLYLGTMSIVGLPAFFIFFDKTKRWSKLLLIGFLIGLVGVIRPIPFDLLFCVPPFSMTFANYWLPEYFLFTAVLSAYGCGKLIEKVMDGSLFKEKQKVVWFGAIVTLLALLPLLLKISSGFLSNIVFDKTFELPRFSTSTWVSNSIFACTTFLSLFLSLQKKRIYKIMSVALFIIVGSLSLIICSYKSLPLRPEFNYPAINLRADAREERILSIGNHLLKPDNNLIYNLPLFEAMNPIFPKGFIEFAHACGAKSDQYKQVYAPCLSPLLTIAGVGKILSEQPVLDGNLLNDPRIKLKAGRQSIDFGSTLNLKNIEVLYDAKTHSIFLLTSVTLKISGSCCLCCDVVDSSGKSISYIEPVIIDKSNSGKQIICSALIPEESKDWHLLLKVMCLDNHTFVPVGSCVSGSKKTDTVAVAHYNVPSTFVAINNKRFSLVGQHGSILEYKDNTACKRYFFVKKVFLVKDGQASLDYLKSHAANMYDTAVLEEKNCDEFVSLLSDFDKRYNHKQEDIELEKGKIEEKNIEHDPFISACDYSLKTESKNVAFLVDSDICYPGWDVYIDGKRYPIFRIDYLFRGVIIPAGTHTIRFLYHPLSVKIGLLLFALTLLAISLSALKIILSTIKGKKDENDQYSSQLHS